MIFLIRARGNLQLAFFLGDIIQKSIDLSKTNDGQKLVPSHLKSIIEKDEQYAFLKELVKGVPSLDEVSKQGKKTKNSKAKRK